MIDFDEMKAALKADLPDDTGKAQLGLIAIAEIERLRAALAPFADYGAILRGQRVRGDTPIAGLWGNTITVNDFIRAADTSEKRDK